MDDARAKISAWRTHHNESRPHSAPDWATPTGFARRCEGEAITGHRAVGFASLATTSSVVHSALAM
ncbi:integrase core domain-containing protein [Cupriavidus sp. a3]|uniref:integrase core domain-containing protein n=1 Tax=Cupriavidus sp. a3 TaxID=3242158 RepID=UPI003D9C4772